MPRVVRANLNLARAAALYRATANALQALQVAAFLIEFRTFWDLPIGPMGKLYLGLGKLDQIAVVKLGGTQCLAKV